MRRVFAGDEDVDTQAGVRLQHLLELVELSVQPQKVLRAADDPDEVDGGLRNDELTERGHHNRVSERNTGATSDSEDIIGDVAGPARTVRTGHDDWDISLACKCCKLRGLTLASAQKVGVVLDLTRQVGHRGDSERVRLPDAQAGEAKEEVLTRLPSLLLVVKVKTNDDVVTLANELHMCHRALEAKCPLSTAVDVECLAQSHTLVESDENQACYQPAPEFIPVSPAGSAPKDSTNRVGDLEEFVASPTDHSLHAEYG